jgi:hypothetical protein
MTLIELELQKLTKFSPNIVLLSVLEIAKCIEEDHFTVKKTIIILVV